MNDVTIIGGADGPTSIILTGKIGYNWLNIWGFAIVVLLLVPNIIYAIKVRNQKNQCTNKLMNILEQVGRYGCMFLMVFNIGNADLGFHSIEAFLIFAFGNALLVIMYWVIWMLYFNKHKRWKQIALTVLPICLFLLCGITMQHYLLILFGIIFGIGHIYVTNKNRVE